MFITIDKEQCKKDFLEGLKDILDVVGHFFLGMITPICVLPDVNDGAVETVAWSMGKLSTVSFGIFCIVLGVQTGHIPGKINEKFEAANKETVSYVSQALSKYFQVMRPNAKNISVLDFSVMDPVTGKSSSLVSYDAQDKDGDTTRFFSRMNYTIDMQKFAKYVTNVVDLDKYAGISFKNYGDVRSATYSNDEHYVSTSGGPRYDYVYNTHSEYWKDKQAPVNAMNEKLENVKTALFDTIDSAKDFDVQQIGKTYDFNQALLKNALYSNPTLLSNVSGSTETWGILCHSSTKITTDFTTNGTFVLNVSDVSENSKKDGYNFKISGLERSGKNITPTEWKVTVKKDAQEEAKYSDSADYVYSKFSEGDNVLFSQVIKESTPGIGVDKLNDDIVVL